MYDETKSSDQNRVHRATLESTDDSGVQQLINYGGLSGEKHTKVLRVQTYGLSTNAPAGSEGLVLSLANKDMPVVLGMEHPDHRPKGLPVGGTRLYDMNGSYVDLDAAGNIASVSSQGMTFNTQKMEFTASELVINVPNITITGNITHNGNTNQIGSHTDTDAAPD